MLWMARAASFLAATSLFLLQPLVARALVPLYGGTSWIWIAVSVFFQLALIVGYLTAARLRGSSRVRVHGRLSAVALLLTIAGFWVLFQRTTFDGLPTEIAAFLHLLITVGVVAIYLAMASPLLQMAIESDGRIDAYRLYAWSNVGSLAGLLIYPLGMETFLPLRYQMLAWLVIAVSAALLIHRTLSRTEALTEPQPVQWQFAGRGLVFFISAVAGALTIAVTTRLTVDLGALPLLWVLPLVMLLSSFVVAFGNFRYRHTLAAVAPMATAIACYLLSKTIYLPAMEMVLVWCTLLFVIQCGLQTRLRTLAPVGGARGSYYVALASGGFLGSLLIGVLLPYYWDTVSRLASLQWMQRILAADVSPELGWCLIAAAVPLIDTQGRNWRDVIPAVTLGISVLAIASVAWELSTGMAALLSALAITYLPTLARRPVLFAVAVAALVIEGSLTREGYDRELLRTRNVYGVLMARQTPNDAFTELLHGTTVHGIQYSQRNASGEVVPKEPQDPLAYFHRGSKVGEVLHLFNATRCPVRASIVGLGVGTLAAYAKAGDAFEFYEIDPSVIVAAEGRHFSYLSAARQRGAQITVLEGDGRQLLAKRAGPKLDLVIMDAFSSDSVPAHLLTLESFDAANRQLKPGGYLLFNTTNRYFDVHKVVAANAARLGWQYWVSATGRAKEGTFPALWVVVKPAEAAGSDPCAVHLNAVSDPVEATSSWSDEFSSPLRVLKARGLWRRITQGAETAKEASSQDR